jgi:transposase-like protein/IS1 family transposase
MPSSAYGLLILGLFGIVWLVIAWRSHLPIRGHPVVAPKIPRLLKPRTPLDCPTCCPSAPDPTLHTPVRAPVRPWREIKSRRGAPKRIPTQGFACPTPTCPYYRVTDAHVHALVGDGSHGKSERIQTFRCQACRTTFSARRNTPLYRLKTPAARVGEVLTALCEGLDVSAAGRVFGYHPKAVTAWLTRAGQQSARLHHRTLQHLTLAHIQLDELRTRLRGRTRVLWLWLAIDPLSKLIPVLQLGPRTQNTAHSCIHTLRQQLASTCLPVFTSDGLNLYFYALTAHFGEWVKGKGRQARHWQVAAGLIYGQVKKVYRRYRLVRVTHRMRCGTEEELRTALIQLGLGGRLNTAFIERVNLTLRQSVSALIRRSWSTAELAPQLLVHLEWWRAYYHFARPHEGLRVAWVSPRERRGNRLPQRYWQRTPAMAAGFTSRCWTVQELLRLPLPPEHSA